MASASLRHLSSLPMSIIQDYSNPNQNYTPLALMTPFVSPDVDTATAKNPQAEIPTDIDTATRATNQQGEMDLLVNNDTASLGGMDEMEEEDEHFFMHSTHQKSSASKSMLL